MAAYLRFSILFSGLFLFVSLSAKPIPTFSSPFGVAEIPSIATQVDSLPTAASIEVLAKAAMDSFDVPGFAIGIVKDGKVVLSKGYGVRKIGTDEAVDANTLFAIASNTKAFVGTMAAMLEDEGKLSLKDPVSQYLPYLRFPSEEVTKLAIVEDLMTHRTGLGTFKGDHLWFKRSINPREVLTKVRELELEYPFRAGYGYSNVMFIAAGEVIGKVAGKPWSEAVETQIFAPLGMNRTVTRVRDLPKDNFAYGHITRQENNSIPPVAWDAPGAAGGIWSSSNDMLKWISCNLNDGVYKGDTVWSKQVQRTTMRPKNVIGAAPGFTSYGLGWFLSNDDGHLVAGHGGGYDGMYSRVVLVPDLNLGIVVLTNSMTGFPRALSTEIVNQYMGKSSATWLDDGLKGERAGHANWFTHQDSVSYLLSLAQNKPDAHPLVLGTYRDATYGNFTVTAGAGKNLELSFPQAPQLDALLQPVGGDHYKLTWRERHAWVDQGLAFTEQKDGKLALRLYIPNEDIFYDSILAVKVSE
jgi:CubicO group peptidase (beta-lactamase class C family)